MSDAPEAADPEIEAIRNMSIAMRHLDGAQRLRALAFLVDRESGGAVAAFVYAMARSQKIAAEGRTGEQT